MYPSDSLLRNDLIEGHQQAWLRIGQAGDFCNAAERIEIVRASRQAEDCPLCKARKEALSPYSMDGEHAGETFLNAVETDLIHRLSTDPGRLTKQWFEGLLASGLDSRRYIEIVSVVTTRIIIDTMHQAMGMALPDLPQATDDRSPRGQFNSSAVDIGAWVPVLDAADDLAATGLPTVPNIARSMGLVPSALNLFFGAFRPHYALSDVPLSISQAQAEFVASVVSAHNECFY